MSNSKTGVSTLTGRPGAASELNAHLVTNQLSKQRQASKARATKAWSEVAPLIFSPFPPVPSGNEEEKSLCAAHTLPHCTAK